MLPVRHLHRDHLREQGICQARRQGILHMLYRLRAPSLLTRVLVLRQVGRGSMLHLKESYQDLVTHLLQLGVALPCTQQVQGSPHHGLGRHQRTPVLGRPQGQR